MPGFGRNVSWVLRGVPAAFCGFNQALGWQVQSCLLLLKNWRANKANRSLKIAQCISLGPRAYFTGQGSLVALFLPCFPLDLQRYRPGRQGQPLPLTLPVLQPSSSQCLGPSCPLIFFLPLVPYPLLPLGSVCLPVIPPPGGYFIQLCPS